MSANEVVEFLASDADSGLTYEEAKERRQVFGENVIFPIRQESFRSVMKKYTMSPLSVLLILSCLISAFFGGLIPFLIITAVTIINYVMITMIYLRAERVFSGIGEYSLPVATVIRSGRVEVVPSKSLVPGDIILIKAGQIVPADCRLIECDRLTVIETGITEGMGLITKNASAYDARLKKPHECSDMVFAATIVVSGEGRAVVTDTGANSLIGKKNRTVTRVSFENQKGFRRLGSLSRVLSLLLIVAVALLTVLSMVKGGGALDSLTLSLALAVSLMSESYALFAFITVAVGIFGSLDKGAAVNGSLIKNVEKLDVLSDITTVMIPCESVYSQRGMKLDKLYLHGRMFDISPDITPGEEEISLLTRAVISTGNYTASRLISKNQRRDNVYTYEEEAIIKAASDAGIYNVGLDSKYPIIGHASLQDAPFETTLISWYGENRVFMRGELSALLPLCTDYSTGQGNTTARLSPVVRTSIETIATQMMRQSKRVVAVASGASRYNSLIKTSGLYRELVFEGLLGFDEPVLPGAARTVQRCADAGIKVVLFSENEDERSLMLAGMLDIIPSGNDGEGALYASKARELDEGVLLSGLKNCRLLCGFSAPERRRIVRALRERGEKIAYLGRNIDEIMICSEADVSATQVLTISQKGRSLIHDKGSDGASYSEVAGSSFDGCDAMRFSSDVIVSSVMDKGNGGFNALVRAIGVAKSIYRNLSAVFSYLIFSCASRTALALITLFGSLAGSRVTPVQIIVEGLVIDLFAVMTISFSHPEKRSLMYERSGKKYPIGWMKASFSLLCGLLAAAVSAAVSNLFPALLTLDISKAGICMSFISLLSCSLIMALESKKRSSLFSGEITVSRIEALFTAALVGFIALCFVIKPLGEVFGIYGVGIPALLASLIPAALLTLALELEKLIENKGNTNTNANANKGSSNKGK